MKLGTTQTKSKSDYAEFKPKIADPNWSNLAVYFIDYVCIILFYF